MGNSRLEQLERMVLEIGKGRFDRVRIGIPDPACALVVVRVGRGEHAAQFSLDFTDLSVPDELLGVLLESRLDGVEEWAHWDEQERAATESES